MADARDAPTKPDVATGRRQQYTLDERFEHLREIARGGMGRVVEARDRHLGRIVAVKESLDDHPDALRRFEREVAITARLEHPSIVPVYDAGVAADGTPFYVMRRVSGAPLDRLIARARTLDKRLALLPHLLAVADAIAHAHQRGIIHRDIKPSNVLVGELGETVVIDWGLAKLLDEDELPGTVVRERGTLETAAGAVIGTPGFMAPEQVTAGTTDTRSDVYALGACLYYLLAGKTPFHGSDEDQVLARTRDGALDPLDDAVPEELATMVRIAMATDPARRYLDAGGLSEDLRRFLAGQLVASHRYSRAQRVWRWLSRHRTAAVALAGLAIAAVVAVVLVRRLGVERARSATKSDDVVIVQATELVTADPTRAMAILKGLRADSPRWASLGPLLAEARARGIAVGYPGHTDYDQLAFPLDREDHRVLSVGWGVIRVIDLVARRSRVIAQGPPGMKAWWCGALVLYSSDASKLRLVDARTGAAHDIAWPREVASAAAAFGRIAFVDAAQRVVTLDARALPVTTAPASLPDVDDAKYVDLSPSGRWLVVYRAARTELYEHAGGWRRAVTLPVIGTQPRFTRDEERFAYRDDTDLSIVEIELPAGRERHRWKVTGVRDLAYAGTALHADTDHRIVRLADTGETFEIDRSDSPSLFSLGSAGEFLAVLGGARRITLVHGTFRRTLRAPVDLVSFAADPAGRYVVAIGGGALLAWDLAPVLPRVLPIDADTVDFRDGSSILTTKLVDIARRVDNYRFTPDFRVQGKAELGTIGVLGELMMLPGGMIAARDRIDGREYAFDPPLAGRSDLSAIVRTGDDFVVGTMGGTIQRVAPSGQITPLAALGVQTASVAAAGRWVAAQTHDGQLWRSDGTRATVAEQAVGIELADDGTVYVGSRGALVAWRTTGVPATVADFGTMVLAIRRVAGGRIAVFTRDHAVHLYEPATRATRLVANGAYPTPGPDLDISADGTLTVAPADRALWVVQLATGARWSIADRFEPQSLSISPDARYLIASELGGTGLFRFDVTLPPATAAWVARTTTARVPRSPTAVLEWASP